MCVVKIRAWGYLLWGGSSCLLQTQLVMGSLTILFISWYDKSRTRSLGIDILRRSYGMIDRVRNEGVEKLCDVEKNMIR